MGGALSLGAYGVTIWAMTQAPIPLVAALRETSVLFAIAIGVVWLEEPLRRERLLAGGLILAGVTLSTGMMASAPPPGCIASAGLAIGAASRNSPVVRAARRDVPRS